MSILNNITNVFIFIHVIPICVCTVKVKTAFILFYFQPKESNIGQSELLVNWWPQLLKHLPTEQITRTRVRVPLSGIGNRTELEQGSGCHHPE